jgi:hypothetical protein
MKTLDLKEAAQFLKLHFEEVRRRARRALFQVQKLGEALGVHRR